MNPFKQKKYDKNDIKRNSFDLSFTNNASFEFGKLYPVFCKEVIPGDSFNIEAAMALNLQPMVFPVQTRMYANLHFFYCRNRAVWKDWKDYQFKTKDGLVAPFIKQSSLDFWKTGSLADYLGVPTTGDSGPVVGAPAWSPASINYDNPQNLQLGQDGFFRPVYPENDITSIAQPYFTSVRSEGLPPLIFSLDSSGFLDVHRANELGSFSNISFCVPFYQNLIDYDINNGVPQFSNIRVQASRPSPSQGSTYIDFYLTYLAVNPDGRFWSLENLRFPNFNYLSPDNVRSGLLGHYQVHLTDGSWSHETFDFGSFSVDDSIFAFNELQTWVRSDGGFSALIPCLVSRNMSESAFINDFGIPFISRVSLFSTEGLTFMPAVPNYPWQAPSNGDDPVLSISAFPFRHYEAIYNTFYRNSRVDPFMKLNPDTGNYEACYNEWNTTVAGGADETPYHFFYRNWEEDFLTSAQLSPQQGIAPLVGVNDAGIFFFEDEQGNISSLHAVTGPDGHTLTGIDAVSPNLPLGSLQQVMQYINHGISINDFRNVNSLQRWLEKNLRNGFKYRDLIRAHYGVDVHYNELDMPEFIGGISDMINVSKVVNTNAANSSTPLGEFAGMASLFSQSKHSINKWCDENGFIIGILSVTPVPVYQSVLPKHFLKHDALDYFNDEFAKIGMQPIFYSEVSPIQAAAEGRLNDLFGYQKAWYDYMASVDEAHGDMRESLNDFIMMRKFATSPELGRDFITVNPNELNNVFASTERNDKIYGSIYFQCYAKRPIPVNVVPALE